MKTRVSIGKNWLPALAWMGGLAPLSAAPFFLGEYPLFLLSEMLIWSLFAVSFNLVYGYTGLLSFGQAIFFGIGAYAIAFFLLHTSIGLLAALGFAIIVAMFWGAVVGLFAIRLTGHSFVIITVIFSLVLLFIFLNKSDITGGDTGLPFEVPPLLLGSMSLSVYNPLTSYYLVLIFTVLPFLLYRQIICSPLGLIFTAVRDNSERTRFLGYNPAWYRFLSFVVAAGFAGLAGALYAVISRYANALLLHWQVSGEAVVWAIVGGAGTLFGPVIGTIGLLTLRDCLSSWNEHIYPIILGVLLLATVLLAPEGIVGMAQRRLFPFIARRWKLWRVGSRASYEETTSDDVMPGLGSDAFLIRFLDRERAVLSPDEAWLQIRGISKEFVGYQAIVNLNLGLSLQTVDQNRFPVVAIIGPNGSGKTTLFNIITGRVRANAGEILYSGQCITRLSAHRIADLGIVRTFQHNNLFWNLTVEENIWVGLMATKRLLSPITPCSRIPRLHAETDAILQLIGLNPYRGKLVRELSYGMQRLLEIGIALAARPRLLLMDEPTAGLSEEATQSMVEVIRTIARGIPVVLIEHDFQVVGNLADRVVVLSNGRLIAEGTIEDVQSQEVVRNTFWRGEVMQSV